MPHIIDDYLLALRPELNTLSLRERDTVLRETRAHLRSEAARLRKEDATLSKDEAELKATAAFGEPRDIAVAYGPQGGLVRRSTGDVVLHVAVLTGRGLAATGRAVGRGAKTTIKWGAIVALILFVAALILAVVVLVSYKDTVRDAAKTATSYTNRQLVSRSEAYSSPTTVQFQDSFDITERTVSSDLRLIIVPTNDPVVGQLHGCLFYTITGPDDQVFAQNTGNCNAVSVVLSPAAVGHYSIGYTLVAYQGTLQVSGYATERIGDA